MKREFIIAEIRRVARELGRAPGKGEFLKRAGIREIDWSGRYWLRWSEALSEAGYERNKLNVAIPEESSLEKLCLLVREFGHFPNLAEMAMKHRTDPSFSDARVFSKRFSRRAEQIARVVFA